MRLIRDSQVFLICESETYPLTGSVGTDLTSASAISVLFAERF